MEQQQQQFSAISENSITFKVDDVELSKELPELRDAEMILSCQGIRVEVYEDFSHKDRHEEDFVLCFMCGFLGAVHSAYEQHYALKLSVSDFIILIGQGLSHHIEANAEKLRDRFVSHEGKEKIVIQRDEFVKGQQNDWSTVFGEFTAEIKKRVKNDIYEVIIDDTSVATPITRIVSEITLMSAMKNYYDASMRTMCGIPQITLEGSAEDWKKLQDKVAKLVEMNKDDCLELKWWLDKLVPVVEKICEAGIQRKIDTDFWGSIYKEKGMSGSTYITGWVTTFYPYLTDNKVNKFSRKLTTSQIPKPYSKVDFVWNYLGEEIPMTFMGGFLGAEFFKETSTVKPAHFWSVYDKLANEDPSDEDDGYEKSASEDPNDEDNDDEESANQEPSDQDDEDDDDDDDEKSENQEPNDKDGNL